MATRTTYLSLIKPDYVDDADIADINANMDTLDNAVHDVSEGMKFSGKTFTVGTASTCDFTTIQAAIDAIPVGTCRAILNIAVGNYPEDVVVRDKGLETLSLIGTNKDTTTIKSLSIEGNLRCVIDKLGFYGLSANKRTIDVNGACYFEMTASNLIGSNVADSIGVSIHGGSGLIHNCSITKYTNGVLSAYGATMFAYSIQGSNNTHDLYANGGLIVTDNNTTLSRFSEYGGAVICKALGASLTSGVADSTTATTDNSKKLATTEFLKKSYLNLGGGTLTGDLGLNLSGGKLTGGIMVSENHADSEVIFINGNTYLALRNEKDTREGTANTFSLVNKINGVEYIFESRNNGTLLWRNMLMEVVNSQGYNWIRYESGMQMCWTILEWTSSYSWTFPAAFSAEPTVQVTPVSAGVYAYAESPSGSGTYCNIKANAGSYFKVLAIGRWK